MITIEVQSTRAVIRSQEPLTVGLRGAKVHFSFGQDWENLTKTAVFRQGERTVTLADVKQEAVIPWEVLTVPGVPVQIGIYGIGEDKAIPTLWTSTQPVRPGADPEADPSTEPTPGLWEQMQSQLRAMEEAVTEVQEQPRSLIVTVIQQPDGTYIADCDPEQIKQAVEDQWILGCYWYDKDMMLSLSAFQPMGPYTFTAVCDATEYRVLISQSGVVTCSEIDLWDSSVKVTVTEQSDGTYTADLSHEQLLEAYNNGKILFCLYSGKIMPLVVASKAQMVFGCILSDRIYTVTVGISRITATDTPMVMEVPVTSVNGKTGDVMLPTSMTVTVTEQSDGSYTADLSHEQLLEAYNNGSALFCKCGGKILSLLVANKSQMVFGCVYTGHIYTATVGISRVSVATTPLTSSEEAVLYTPQALTPEQQAQARENIGLTGAGGDIPSDMNVVWQNILSFTVEEETAEINVPITDVMERIVKATDVYLYFKAAEVSSADFIGQSPKGSISIKAGTTSRSILTDAPIAPTSVYVSNTSSRYSVETFIRFFINKNYKTMDYKVKPANANDSSSYNKGVTFYHVAGSSHYLNIRFTDSVIGKDSILEIYVPGYQRSE